MQWHWPLVGRQIAEIWYVLTAARRENPSTDDDLQKEAGKTCKIEMTLDKSVSNISVRLVPKHFVFWYAALRGCEGLRRRRSDPGKWCALT